MQGGLAIYKLYESNSAPVCDLGQQSINSLWLPDHTFVPIEVEGVADPDGDPLTNTVESVHQDERVDSTGDGASAPDAQGVGTASVEVRVERAGNGDGRVYHIAFTANDGQGVSEPISGIIQSSEWAPLASAVDGGLPHERSDQ